MSHSSIPAARRSVPDRRESLVALVLFVFLSYVYLLLYSGVSHNPDEWFFLLMAESVVRGDLASVPLHGWLFSVLLSPFYWLSPNLPQTGMVQVTALLNGILTPLTAALLFLCLGELDYDRRDRLFTALGFALATFVWPHSRYLMREPMTALLLIIALWSAIRFWRRPSIGSLIAFTVASVLALVTKAVTVALLPFFGLLLLIPLLRRWAAGVDPVRHPRQQRLIQLWQTWRAGLSQRSWSSWLLPAAVVVGLLLFVSFVAWRSPLLGTLVPSYQDDLRQQGVNLTNTLALWISPGWGVLVYAPVLWISVLGIVPFARRYPAIAFATLGGSLAFTMAASPHEYWWGNWAFGPRQMVLLLPLLCLPMPAGLAWLRSKLGGWGYAAAAGLFALSVAFQLIGSLAPYGQYVNEVYFAAGIQGPDIAWNLRLWPIGGLTRYLRPELLDWAWIASRPLDAVTLKTPLVLALAGMALLAGVWLGVVVYAVQKSKLRHGALLWAASIALALLWLPIALRAVQSIYLDPRFQPELGFQAAAETVRNESQPGDLLLTELWTERLTGPVEAMVNYCQGGCPPRFELLRENLTDREENWTVARLDDLAGYRRVWLVLDRVMEGDPNSVVEQWLGRVGYQERCRWTGPQVRLCLYSLESGAVLQSGLLDAAFGEQIRLRSAQVRLAGYPPAAQVDAAPGDTLQVELRWKAQEAPSANYVMSLQLLGPDGALAAAADRTPGNGFRPTTGWQPGEPIADRLALAIPNDASPGLYYLHVVLYDPATGQRLPVQVAGAPAGDGLLLLELPVMQ